jgi:hypothetical protein
VAQFQALTAELIEQSPERHPVLVKFDRGRVRYMTVVRIGNEPKRPEIARSRRPGLSAAELQALSPDLAEALGCERPRRRARHARLPWTRRGSRRDCARAICW